MPQARRRGSDTNQSRDKWQGWGALACTNSSSPSLLARERDGKAGNTMWERAWCCGNESVMKGSFLEVFW